MKHCILVKFNKDYDWKSELPNIRKIFDGIKIDGVNGVEYIIMTTSKEPVSQEDIDEAIGSLKPFTDRIPKI